MKKFMVTGLCMAIITTGTIAQQNGKAKKGWQNLLDKNSTKGWHTYNKPGSIGSAWSVKDGVLHLNASEKSDWQTKSGGDIVFEEVFDNFHLKLEWKISKNGNSGIMFLVQEDEAYKYPWLTGPEMQILDNDGHADGKIIKHRAGDLYDLISCSTETVRPVGKWNLAEIILKDSKLTFKLNGKTVVTTTLWDENWNNMVANSKFKNMPDFGKFKSGKIALQDHGDDVWFRNIKVKRL
jgi:hypothetical protein